jgi:demethylmenaquinone methyltransferase/2-methoxy-6-polyprenyl-1,4-benzoquinol methylase
LLEIGRPSSGVALALLRFYLGRVVPLLSRLSRSGRHAETLMHYYWDTIQSCVPPETIVAAMRAAGLQEANCKTDIGLFKTYSAVRR